MKIPWQGRVAVKVNEQQIMPVPRRSEAKDDKRDEIQMTPRAVRERVMRQWRSEVLF
ncbi:hypothetical protein L13192_10666 [Pyrenophora tritici-repentis]|nr:hypothetical protein L13192_10666 [Pyrenophora tritici-repentis]